MKSLSFQMYSARNTALQQSLEIVASAGYSAVEAYGGNFEDALSFKRSLAQSGLAVSSIHMSRDELASDLTACIARAKEFETQYIVCPYLVPEDRPDSALGWIALAQQLSGFAELITAAGLHFSWHNHDFEFFELADGSMPMDLLMDSATNMGWEMDVGWIQRAGQDPLLWLERYGQRIHAIHLKDLAATGQCSDEDGWADVGHGVIDWTRLVPLFKQSSAAIFVAEHDNPSDLQRFAKRSFDSIQQWGW